MKVGNVLHGIEGVEREFARISGRPESDPDTPVLAHVTARANGDPEGWEFWDVTRSADGSGRLNVWLDTWGEPFFSWEELRWLLYTCGADLVGDPVVAKTDSWAQEPSA